MHLVSKARTGIIIGTLAIGVIVGSPLAIAVSESAAPATMGQERYKPSKEECTALRLINDFRNRHGKPPLRMSVTLGAAAAHHSADMARKDYFSHDLKSGPTWDRNIRQHGYRGNPIGENIAAGMPTARKAVKAWIKSKPHRKGMLNGSFRAIGVGLASDKRSTYVHYWTTTFGGEVDREVSCK
jgi:uncharacterized protein YkwD